MYMYALDVSMGMRVNVCVHCAFLFIFLNQISCILFFSMLHKRYYRI